MKPKFLPISKMAEYIGFSVEFLRKKRGELFFEGEHYYKPAGMKHYVWDVDAMENWAKGNISDEAKKVLDRLLV